MISLLSLWLPILFSAVIVFLASSVIHMTPLWHQNDFPKLPREADLLNALRPFAIPPGDYFIPRAAGMQELKSAEFIEKIVVRVPDRGRHFRGLHRQPDLAVRHALHARVPDRGRDHVHRLFARAVRAIYLVPALVEPDAEGVPRRPDLRPAHGGHVRMVVAALAERCAPRATRGVRHAPRVLCPRERFMTKEKYLHVSSGAQNLRIRHVCVT